jgi:hypothetical protein
MIYLIGDGMFSHMNFLRIYHVLNYAKHLNIRTDLLKPKKSVMQGLGPATPEEAAKNRI